MTYTLHKIGPTGYVHTTRQYDMRTLWRHALSWGSKPGWKLIVEPD